MGLVEWAGRMAGVAEVRLPEDRCCGDWCLVAKSALPELVEAENAAAAASSSPPLCLPHWTQQGKGSSEGREELHENRN